MKRSREFRFEQKEKFIKKRLKDVKNAGTSGMLENFLNKKNILSKKDGFDCGKRQCGLCRTCKKQHKKDLERKLPLEDNTDG
jgi:hypothetical protein